MGSPITAALSLALSREQIGQLRRPRAALCRMSLVVLQMWMGPVPIEIQALGPVVAKMRVWASPVLAGRGLCILPLSKLVPSGARGVWGGSGAPRPQRDFT